MTELSRDTCHAASIRATLFVDRLAELEAAVEKQKNSIRFYTPSAPIIGMNPLGAVTSLNDPAAANRDDSQIYEEQAGDDEEDSAEAEDDLAEMELETSEEEEREDVMDELEDSTGSPF